MDIAGTSESQEQKSHWLDNLLIAEASLCALRKWLTTLRRKATYKALLDLHPVHGREWRFLLLGVTRIVRVGLNLATPLLPFIYPSIVLISGHNNHEHLHGYNRCRDRSPLV